MATRCDDDVKQFDEEKPSKKARITDKDQVDDQSIIIKSLESVKLVKVLWNDIITKTIFVHGNKNIYQLECYSIL